MFDIEPGEFFQEHSDQNETNFHNVMQHYLKHHGFVVTKTRQIAAIVLLAYGVILPILNAFAPFRSWLRTCRVVVPPPALIPGFLLGAVLAWFDWPTGREEELGEVLFSLCFALLVPLWRLQQDYLAESVRARSEPTRAEADHGLAGASAFTSAHFLVVNSLIMRTTSGPSTLAELSKPVPA